MDKPVNYIRHLQGVFQIISGDHRLTPWHLSLYYALFHSWNASKFSDTFSINRSEMMSLSKIGSVNTYSKCLRQLHDWKYIKYSPSKSAQRGSKIHMFIFDTTGDTTPSTTTDTTSGQPVIQHVVSSINNLNKEKQSKPIKQSRGKSRFASPKMDEVKEFFLELNSTAEEAEQFYDHFESNGWLVAGKAKMKDWKAAARNWIKRSAKFSQRTSSAAERSKGNNNNRLNTNQNKDYSIPL
ncbi:MAG: transcriptional regulator [Crocinitomicaceae bacterium]|nr:transcriptional regulator [Crocinitomicaceae bacterium]